MLRNRLDGSGETELPPLNREHSRRYGPHRISYHKLMELKTLREYYLRVFNEDICDRPPRSLYKKYLDDLEPGEDVWTDDEDDVSDEELENEIHVKKVNLNHESNAINHHTSDYKCIRKRKVEGKERPAALVIRRGAPFKIKLEFDRKYDPKLHDLKFQFTLGFKTSISRGTEVTLVIDGEREKFDDSGKWQACIVSKIPSRKLEVEFLSPPDCIIGDWDLHIYTISKDKRNADKMLHYKHNEDIFIVLNPWCKEDDVYFPMDPDYDTDVDPREEYVLNPVGCLYRSDGGSATEWRFGQFDEDIVQICFRLVRIYFRGIINRDIGDAIKIAMAISSVVNAVDNRGVLSGRWDGNYKDGTSPLSWIGSTKILKEYGKTGKSVKYGQCWVFSGVTVTVCRALGLPCRSITNFSSAHDVDGTLEIERVFKEDVGLESYWGDSIWNFHVWNEVWMARNDIQDKQLNGWQVIDATPQEQSEGLFKCGPCPVLAVKRGLTFLPHDTGFVFAEVNADVTYFVRTASGLQKVGTNKTSVGEHISTKKPTGRPIIDRSFKNRYDVTNFYKYKEGSHEERFAVARALRNAKPLLDDDYEKVEVKTEVAVDIRHTGGKIIGDDIVATATVINDSDMENKLEIRSMKIAISSVNYTGTNQRMVQKMIHEKFYLEPQEKKEFDLKATWEDYKDKRQEMSNFSITVLVEAEESGNLFAGNKVIVLESPELDISASATRCKVGETVDITVKLHNPLSITLTECFLRIEDDRFDDHPDLKVDDIPGNADVTYNFTVRSIRPGPAQVIVLLDTEEFLDIRGAVNINIYE